MFKDLEKLIPPPGHYLLLQGKSRGEKDEKDAKRSQGKKLDLFKEPATAKKVYAIYAKCWNNATELLLEARLLFRNKHYARSVALGIAAWEELGKSQIAADYYSGMLTDQVYREAFRNHGLKTSYLARMAIIDQDRKFKIGFDETIGSQLEQIRQKALYVSETNDPKTAFTKEDANFVLRRVWEHREYIHYAEELNGRIGSKALFK